MKKKPVYTLKLGDQEYEDMEGKENKDNATTTSLLYSEADRCPICLTCLLEKEVGFPESCNHAFCMTCILKWAETVASCPIDRKPFQAVIKFSTLEDCIKVQIKKQLIETSTKNENSFKKQLFCHENSKCYIRKKVLQEDRSANFYDLKLIHRNLKCCEIGEKNDAAIKTYKPQRSSQCTSHFSRNFFSNVHFPNSHTVESSFTFRTYCTEYMEVDETSALIRQKRQELELSWFPDTFPGIGRIGFVPWNIETAVLPLISSVLPRPIFPTSTRSLESLGTSYKGYALAHTQGGEEKKQTSGTSNTRGSRRKPAATTPTRRSTRHTRAETVSQSQASPVSNNSGCDTPDNNNTPVSVPSSAESEKQTRQAPKRKSVRRGRKPPLVKKKLRSSMPSPEKPSSDSVDEETAESDTPPVLEKEQQADIERTDTSMQENTESESANGLESCNENVEDNAKHTEHNDEQERAESSSYSESCTQDTPLVVSSKNTQDDEEVVTETNILCLDSDSFKSISEKERDSFENKDEIPEPLESEIKTDISTDHSSNDFLKYSVSTTEVHESLPNLSELSENAESVADEEQLMESPVLELPDDKDSAVKTECLIDSPKLESLDSEMIQAVDKQSIENSGDQSQGCIETEDVESVAMCGISGNEILDSTPDSENNLLKNSIKVESSLEEKTQSLVEHPRCAELTDIHTEQIQKHLSEDNNETIPMECDSFCSGQNESEIELSASADTKQLIVSSMEIDSQDNPPSSDSTNEKSEIVSQPPESSLNTVEKAKKPRTRRSRFHSSSTTWSPHKDTEEEKKRSPSPSPKKETGKESRKSLSPPPVREPVKEETQSHSQSPKKETAGEKRPFQSQSPKRESTEQGKGSESLSPKKHTVKENKRSQSKMKAASPREQSRSQSRERENDRDGQKRDLGREKRTGMWSRSRSRSRSPSRSRTKSKSSSFSRNDRDSYSPRMKERWPDDGWRCSRDGDWYRKDDSDRQNENARKEKYNISSDADDRNECPSWVTEKLNFGPDPRTRNPEKFKNSHWEDNRNENSGHYWNKNFGSGWMPHRGRGHRGRGHRGRGNYRGGFSYTDQNENRWQNRKPLSGNSNSSGNETFKSVEQQPNKQKNEQQFSFDTAADRSGWTSASSWAVRKTLPADVQNYYSRRGRNSSGSQSAWMRQEEETTEQDSSHNDQTNQQGDGSQLPINMMPPQMNVMQPQMNVPPQPMNIFPYPMGVHAPMMNMPRHPFNMHPQLPLHLHTGMPLMQVAAPATVSQGLLPPPPPPPPPSQQVSYVAAQPDGKQLQGVPGTSHVSNNMSTPVVSAPAAAPGNTGTVQGPSSGNTSSSSHSKASNAAVNLAESKVSVTVEASADSSKTDKKLQIQEKAAQEVKLAIKPFYQNKDITKDEYKEIVRKAVDKVCHSKSGEVNSTKVANLVKAYVDKYKYSRKGSQKKTVEEPVSAEKNIG